MTLCRASVRTSAAKARRGEEVHNSMRIGWIGIGNMGANMAELVMENGYELAVYDTVQERVENFQKKGALAASSPKELMEMTDICFSTIPNGPILKAVALGENGVAAGCSGGKIYVDISTVDVNSSAEVGEAVAEGGGYFLRCPVSGSTIQARNGSLVVMVSGDKGAFDRAKPVLDLFGKEIYYMGEKEEARVMKLVIQSMVGTQFQSYAEALVLGEKCGVDWETMIEILSKCSAASTNIRNKVDEFKNRDFTPMSTVFTQLKDMNLVADLAKQYNVPMPVTSVSTQYYNAMVSSGRGLYDYAAILLVNEENCGIYKDKVKPEQEKES